MVREITAHASSEEEVRTKLHQVALNYPDLTMGKIKIIGPARTPTGGTQYVGKCRLS